MSSRSAPESPPRLARRTLARLLHPTDRDEILVEMDDLYASRSRRYGRLRADVWYLRRSLGFPLRLAGEQLSDSAPALIGDLRHAFGSLRHEPGFVLLVAGVLALGVGGTTAFFSIVDHALLRPLPYHDQDRLVALGEYRLERGVPAPGQPDKGIAYLNFVELRRQLDSVARLGVIAPGGALLLGADRPRRIRTGSADPLVFDMLGLAPVLGRPLRPGDRDRAVLSYGTWRDLFGASEDAIGTTLTLDGQPHEIAGVMPPGFLANLSYDVWVPFVADGYRFRDQRGFKQLTGIARIRDEATLEQVDAALRIAESQLSEAYPETNGDYGLWMRSLHEESVGATASVYLKLFGAAALLLAIACLNVTSLQLARFTRRRRDAAVRAALGAGRSRILRLMAIESLLIGLLGAAGGVLLAIVAVRSFVALSPTSDVRLAGAGMDLRALTFAVAVACTVGVLAGVLPLSRLRMSGLLESLQLGSRGASEGRGGRRLRDGLLVVQVAVTTLLLGAAALVSASFLRLWTYDLGFEPDGVLTFGLTLNRDTYPEPADQYAFYEGLFETLRAIPEIEDVAATSRRPLSQADILHQVRPESDLERRVETRLRPVSSSYFDLLRVPLIAGRTFNPGEQEGVLVNASAAHRLWAGTPPAAAVGRRIRFVRPRLPDGQPMTSEVRPWLSVIGVVGDMRYQGLDPEPVPAVYKPLWQDMRFGSGGSFGEAHLLLRARAQPTDLSGTIQRAVRRMDPQEPVEDLLTMNEVVGDSMARPRFYAFLFTCFASLAVAFCFAGVFGVTAYLVASRSREIGVRVALGAAPAAVARLVLTHGATVAGIGLVIGLLGGFALARYVEGFVYGISTTDPRVLSAAVAILALAILGGMTAPCLRALRVDPVLALRDG